MATRESSLPPWLTLWFQPRTTYRRLAGASNAGLLVVLAGLGGIGRSLSESISQHGEDRFDLSVLLPAGAVVGSLYGLGVLYAGSVLLQRTASWLGGEGTVVGNRVAIAWSSVPQIAVLVLTLLSASLVGRCLFMSNPMLESVVLTTFQELVLAAHTIGSLIISLWGFFTLVKMTAEAQGFSAWRAWCSLVLAFLIVFVPVVAVVGRLLG